MNWLFHKGTFYKYPESWNELSKKQLIQITAVLNSGIDERIGRLKLLLILLGWSRWKLIVVCGLHRFFNLEKVSSFKFIPVVFGRYLDNTERMATAAETLTQFLFEKNNLTVNLLPRIKGLHGPASGFGNLKMGEFCFAEHYYLSWKETAFPLYLNLLVATLYRPSNKVKNAGDTRCLFDPNQTPFLARKIDHWPMPVKLAIEAWYHGCRESMINANKPVFEYDDGEESASLHGLWSVMRSVAKSGHFGTFDQVANEFVDTIMMELHESIVEHQQMKERLNNAGKTEE